MDGRLDERGQPVLDLSLAGVADSLPVLIDTGFDGELIAYQDQLVQINLQPSYRDVERVRLADGTLVVTLVTNVAVSWHGAFRPVTVNVVTQDAPEGARALLGCQLLRDSTLEVAFPDGTIRITR